MNKQYRLKTHTTLKRQRGVALIISLFAVMVLSFIAVELSYDVSIEYIISNKEYHRLRAYYAAKSGIELSRFRIHVYKQIARQFQGQLAGKQHLLDMIWRFPLVWPITSVLPEDLVRVEREQIQDVVNESLMGSVQYSTQISSEGSKIDLNDLASPAVGLSKVTRMQLEEIFAKSVEEETDFGRELSDSNINYEEIIDNITDWIDNDNAAQRGGDESQLYSDVIIQNEIEGSLPPNRPFRTLQELKMVSGVSSKIYNFLAPHITVYGSKGINPNYTGPHLLRSLDPANITDEVIALIEERKNDPSQGLFKDESDFFSFLRDLGINTQEIKNQNIPFYFGSEYNFMIKSTGISSHVQKDIIAIVYDIDAVASNLSKSIAQNPKAPTTTGATPGPTTNTTTTTVRSNTPTNARAQAPTGPPTIVYWYEP